MNAGIRSALKRYHKNTIYIPSFVYRNKVLGDGAEYIIDTEKAETLLLPERNYKRPFAFVYFSVIFSVWWFESMDDVNSRTGTVFGETAADIFKLHCVFDYRRGRWKIGKENRGERIWWVREGGRPEWIESEREREREWESAGNINSRSKGDFIKCCCKEIKRDKNYSSPFYFL